MAKKGEDNLRSIRGNCKLGFLSAPDTDRVIPSVKCRRLGHLLSTIRITLYIRIMRQIFRSKRSSVPLSFLRSTSLCNLSNF